MAKKYCPKCGLPYIRKTFIPGCSAGRSHPLIPPAHHYIHEEHRSTLRSGGSYLVVDKVCVVAKQNCRDIINRHRDGIEQDDRVDQGSNPFMENPPCPLCGGEYDEVKKVYPCGYATEAEILAEVKANDRKLSRRYKKKVVPIQ